MTQIIPRDLPIFFDEEKHKYTDALDREYISTTTIIGKFVEQKAVSYTHLTLPTNSRG